MPPAGVRVGWVASPTGSAGGQDRPVSPRAGVKHKAFSSLPQLLEKVGGGEHQKGQGDQAEEDDGDESGLAAVMAQMSSSQLKGFAQEALSFLEGSDELTVKELQAFVVVGDHHQRSSFR